MSTMNEVEASEEDDVADIGNIGIESERAFVQLRSVKSGSLSEGHCQNARWVI